MIEKGSYIELDYTGKMGEKVFDTTDKKTAEKQGLRTDLEFKPIVIEVGAGNVIPGIDDALAKMKKGEKKTVKIPAKKGYGERKPELVKIVPLNVFKKNDIHPVPGMPITLDQMPARIQSVSGGRVRVDFNHELAGKELEFDLKVNKVFKKKEDIANALTSQLLPKASVKVQKEKCLVTVKDELKQKDYPQRKKLLISRLENVKGIKKVEFKETYEK
jgi:FKBP-type peptidyl-prolyl cis-trans isomerase 2